MSRQDKPIECFHKIIGFQSHKYCTLNASICEVKCQGNHSHAQNIYDTNRISLQYKAIRSSLTQKIKMYIDQYIKQYEDLSRFFQKKYTQDLKQMQKQLLSQLIDSVRLNREILQKLQNQRPEKIKCNEIFNFMQDLTIDNKIKKADLLPIYQRHINNIKVHLKEIKETQLNLQVIQQVLPYQQLKKQLSIYKQKVKQMKCTIDNLQQEITVLKKSKKGRLSQHTWNVIKISTKKRLKRQRRNKQLLIGTESIKPLENINQNENQQQDFLDFLQRKKMIS